MNKRAKHGTTSTAPASVAVGTPPLLELSDGAAWTVFSFLSCGELAGVHVSSRGLRASVEKYLARACQAGQLGGAGYSGAWKPVDRASAHSVLPRARRLERLVVAEEVPPALKVPSQGEGLLRPPSFAALVARDVRTVRLVQRSAATLMHFAAHYATPSVLFALSSCPSLRSLRLWGMPSSETNHATPKKLALALLLPQLSRLRTLELSGCFFPATAVAEIDVLIEGLAELEELRLDWLPLRPLPERLRRLRISVGYRNETEATLQSFPGRIASLRGLEELDINFLLDDGFNFRASVPEWDLPALRTCRLVYPLELLPRLRAPVLQRLCAEVTPTGLLEAMEGCPTLTELDTSTETMLHYSDAAGWIPEGLTRAILQSAFASASASASSVSGVVVMSGGGEQEQKEGEKEKEGEDKKSGSSSICQWSTTLRSFTLCPAYPLPGCVAVAISRAWRSLGHASFSLFDATSPLAVRALLVGLPSLSSLSLRTLDEIAGAEEDEISDDPPSYTTLVQEGVEGQEALKGGGGGGAEASGSGGEEEAQEVRKLQSLHTALATDATFAGLSFPALSALTLASNGVQLRRPHSLLLAAPCLREFSLRLNCVVECSPAELPARSLPALEHLELHKTEGEVDAIAVGTLLRASPRLKECVVERCVLRVEEILTLLAGGTCPELEEVVVRDWGGSADGVAAKRRLALLCAAVAQGLNGDFDIVVDCGRLEQDGAPALLKIVRDALTRLRRVNPNRHIAFCEHTL